MDWMETNTDLRGAGAVPGVFSNSLLWSDRVQVGADPSRGIPIEHMIELANTVGVRTV
jgi:hypothetical protein